VDSHIGVDSSSARSDAYVLDGLVRFLASGERPNAESGLFGGGRYGLLVSAPLS